MAPPESQITDLEKRNADLEARVAALREIAISERERRLEQCPGVPLDLACSDLSPACLGYRY